MRSRRKCPAAQQPRDSFVERLRVRFAVAGRGAGFHDGAGSTRQQRAWAALAPIEGKWLADYEHYLVLPDGGDVRLGASTTSWTTAGTSRRRWLSAWCRSTRIGASTWTHSCLSAVERDSAACNRAGRFIHRRLLVTADTLCVQFYLTRQGGGGPRHRQRGVLGRSVVPALW